MTARVASFSPKRFGEVFCLEPGFDGLALVLMPPPGGGNVEALPDPFVRLADSGGVASTLVARVAKPQGDHRLVGVLLRSDGEAEGQAAAAGDRWFQGLALSLQALAPGSSTALEPAPHNLPPLWYCKRRDLLFVPPCPSCGEPLSECLDDAALITAGLTSREASPHRYVSCPQCDGAATAPRFYGLVVEPESQTQVGDRWALVDGFGRLVTAGRDAGNPHFPCQGCTFSHSCYPPEDEAAPGEARTLLVPLSFYGGGGCPVEFLPLGYDDASDLLGGRPPAEMLSPWGQSFPEETLQGEASAAFLFPAEREQRLPLEALLLKLTVFEQLCAGVEAIHGSLGRPHLNLNPGTARVALGDGGGAAPTYWSSRAHPIGLDGARPVVGTEEGGDLELLPPTRFDLAFSHPGVATCPGRGEWQPARFAVLNVEDDPAGGCVVEGVLETERIRPGEAGPADTFQIGLGQGLGFRTELKLSCACKGSSGGGVALRSASVQLDAADRERLVSLRALPQVEARFSASRRYGMECDFFSLGMLLFRSLCVNRAQAMDEVSQRCRAIAGELERRTGAGGAGDAIEEELERSLPDPVFDPGNLLWDPLPSGTAEVPHALWREVLVLGFRLLTGIREFSFLAAGAAATAVDGGPLARVRAELRDLLGKARGALLTWEPERATEVREVLSDLIDDPAWLDRILSEGAGPQAVSEVPPTPAAPGGETAAPSPGPAVSPPPPPAEPGFDETVILRSGDVAAAISSTRGQTGVSPGPATERSAGPDQSPGGSSPVATGTPPDAGAGFEETMILRPGDPRVSPGPGPESSTESGGEEPGGEDLEKTIILRRGPPSEGK